ncbi:hypothetical protein [Flavobacterium sp. HSC-61S13]|uniref:hypothetical protein n=1 Tax=Flavobacterium sp. HSC-61S13 TaxID=2910963 RepID=UPI0020A2257D|nr:hypothetical protein [Flavobacterium sp. HSC-61S13]MCP1997182.1 hypothetical protein [Flavobacterium sp. HSC-61S13]
MAVKILFLSLTLMIISCGSFKQTDTKDQSHLGTWVLIQRSGGFTGSVTNFDIKKKEQVLLLEQDKMTRLENGQQKSQQNYTIEKGRVIESSEPQDILKGDSSIPESISIQEGQLILRGQCYDCYTDVYQRIP